MRAVITAGGTSEPIDDVRMVTNFSTGSFGRQIANALALRGVQVTLIGSRSMVRQGGFEDGVAAVPFGSTQELIECIDTAIAEPPEILMMAAAVSDYAPIPTQGKIRSTQDRLVVEMVRTPKILPTLRARCPSTYLVGFKLLSGVPRQELVDVAQAQRAKCGLDLTVANDLQAIVGGQHPVVLCGEDEVTYAGTKRQSAIALVRHVLSAVRGPRVDGPEIGAFSLVELPDLLAVGAFSSRAALTSGWNGRPFVVGTTVGTLDPAHLDEVRTRWTTEAGPGELAFVDGMPRGLHLRGEGWQGVWVAPEFRRKGYGDRLVRAAGQGVPFKVPEEHRAFFIARGYRPAGELLDAPRDLLPAASVCLIDRLDDRVLLGRRKRGAYPGLWSFPGGAVEAGEDGLTAGIRELWEETGIQLVDPLVMAQRSLAVGDGERAWSVFNVTIATLTPAEPVETDELAARWIPLEEARAMSGLTAGTRSVLTRPFAPKASQRSTFPP